MAINRFNFINGFWKNIVSPLINKANTLNDYVNCILGQILSNTGVNTYCVRCSLFSVQYYLNSLFPKVVLYRQSFEQIDLSQINNIVKYSGLYIACTNSGVYTSYNLTEWKITNLSVGKFNKAFVVGNTIAIAGENGIYKTTGSGTGTNTTITSFTAVFVQSNIKNFVDIYGNGIYWVAVGQVVLYFPNDLSTFGIASYISGSLSVGMIDKGYTSVKYGGTYWVITNNVSGSIYYTNGNLFDRFLKVSFQQQTLFNNLIYANSVWFAGSTNGLFTATTPDTWEEIVTLSFGTIYNILYLNNLFVVISSGGTFTSTDGLNFNLLNVNFTINYISYSNNLYTIATNNGLYYTSNLVKFNVSNLNIGSFNYIYSDGSNFLATQNNTIYYSNDGMTWNIVSNSSSLLITISSADGTLDPTTPKNQAKINGVLLAYNSVTSNILIYGSQKPKIQLFLNP